MSAPYDGKIVYTPPRLPDPKELRIGTIFLDNDGIYWELSGWLGTTEEPGVWGRMHKARVRRLRREGRIPE